jgi:hypothetical protein
MARGQAAPAVEQKKEAIVMVLPEGTLINESLYEKDAYVDPKTQVPGKPTYKCEVAYEKASLETVINDVFNHCCDEYGDNIYLNIDAPEANKEMVITMFLDGDKLARDREKKGKEGDAYKGKWVIRANTDFNLNGQNAPGGVAVFDEDVNPIAPMDRGKIYPGCKVQTKVVLDFYTTNRSEPACKFYLSAVQKVGDGTPLVKAQDHASAFKPVGRAANANGGAAEGGRRQRKG